jgi:hypothetical protein
MCIDPSVFPYAADGLAGTLYSEILRFQNYGGFQVGSLSDFTQRQVVLKYEEAVRLQRGLYLIEFLADDGPHNFSVPNVLELFDKLFREPLSPVLLYNGPFTQDITYTIKYLYDHLPEFAKNVVSYFQTNPTSLKLFAYVTFPSLFGSFVASEFCERAFIFLKALFQTVGESDISDTFLASFFFSANGFYNCFWHNLSIAFDKVIRAVVCFDILFDLLENSLISALPFLSHFHIEAFKAYFAVSPEKVGQLTVGTLILKPFLREIGISNQFTSDVKNELFANFLHLLNTPQHFPDLLRLIKQIADYQNSLDLHTSLGLPVWSRLVPVIINDSDIGLLREILKSSGLASTFDLSGINVTNNLNPVRFELNLTWVANIELDGSFGRDLFGVAPPVIPELSEFPNNEVFARNWRILESVARDRGDSITDFVAKHYKSFEPDFLLYCEVQVLIAYQHGLEAIEEKMNIAMYLQQIEAEVQRMIDRSSSFIHCYLGVFFKRPLHRKNRLASVIRRISELPHPPKSISFEVFCCALDCAEFPIAPAMEKAETHFLNMLVRWLDYMQEQKKQFPFEHRKAYVIETAFLLVPISDLRLGRTLQIIVEFQTRLRVILQECENAWQDLFIYALAHAQAPKLLRCFLTLHHFVFQSKDIIRTWSPTANMIWDQFALGMWKAIGGDTKFCARCADTAQAKRFFMVGIHGNHRRNGRSTNRKS